MTAALAATRPARSAPGPISLFGPAPCPYPSARAADMAGAGPGSFPSRPQNGP